MGRQCAGNAVWAVGVLRTILKNVERAKSRDRRFSAICGLKFSPNPSYKDVGRANLSQPIKFLFLLWVIFRGIFDSSVLATAVWCILCYFSNVLWLQCFGIFIAIYFISNIPFVNYIKIHTKQDCLIYMRTESALVGCSIILSLILSPLLTVAAIVLLSLLEVWTNLETHWLHTLLFVTCVDYILLRASGQRKMAMLANKRSAQSAAPRSSFGRVIDV
jgi:hypothetical protein